MLAEVSSDLINLGAGVITAYFISAIIKTMYTTIVAVRNGRNGRLQAKENGQTLIEIKLALEGVEKAIERQTQAFTAFGSCQERLLQTITKIDVVLGYLVDHIGNKQN